MNLIVKLDMSCLFPRFLNYDNLFSLGLEKNCECKAHVHVCICYGVQVTLLHGLHVQTFCTLHCSIRFRLDRTFLFDVIQDKD